MDFEFVEKCSHPYSVESDHPMYKIETYFVEKNKNADHLHKSTWSENKNEYIFDIG